jgi:hypothetical protein
MRNRPRKRRERSRRVVCVPVAGTRMAGDVLVERERELATLGAALVRMEGGNGVTVIIDGPAGIGKTRLLENARRLATHRGARCLSARGSPVEQSYSFEVLRQMLEPVLASEGFRPAATDAGDLALGSHRGSRC